MPAGLGGKDYERFIFRQYGELNAHGFKTFKDYEIYHNDLKVKIYGHFNLIETEEENYIDYPNAVYQPSAIIETPQEAVGLLLLSFKSKIFFRCKNKDYVIRHCDLQVEILEEDYKLIEGKDFNIIDHLKI